MTQATIEKVNTQGRQLQEVVQSTAIDSFVTKNDWAQGVDPAVLFARAEIAAEKPKSDRSRQEKALVHLSGTITAIERAVDSGLVVSPEDAGMLTDAIIYSSMRPSSAIKYLKRAGNTKLGRAITPKELVAALGIYEDFIYEDDTVSVALIVRAADAAGVSLAEGEINDFDLTMIEGSISRYRGGIDIHDIEDDPRDGPVQKVWKKSIAGAALARSGGSINPLSTADREYLEDRIGSGE